MKKIFKYVREFQRKHFDPKLYLTVAFFLVLCFVFNYTLDFENSYLDPLRKTFWRFPAMFVWMAFPFVVITLIIRLMGKDVKLNAGFWFVILIGFGIHAFDRSFYGHNFLFDDMSNIDRRFLLRCANWSMSLLTVVLPLMLVYRMIEHDHPRTYYGLQWHKFDFKPYFVLLGMAILLIGVGSFFSDLQHYYPRYAKSLGGQFAHTHHISEYISVLIYELSYGSDFVSVEVFFRGFLIHAFARTLGGYAVVAMVGSYAFLHFGKPLTEAISSCFGGYLLGIISYNTRSVWGGIVVHIGVAWTMEFFGFLHRVF